MIERTDNERSYLIKQGGITAVSANIKGGTEVIVGDTLEKGQVAEVNFLNISGLCVVRITVGKCNGCSKLRFIDELEKF
jgi:hypothetical protein